MSRRPLENKKMMESVNSVPLLCAKEENNHHSQVQYLLSILNITSEILFRGYSQVLCTVFALCTAACYSKLSRRVQLVLRAVPDKMQRHFIEKYSNLDNVVDVLNCVLVSEDIVNFLCVSNFAWVRLSIQNEIYNSENNVSKYVLVKIIGVKGFSEKHVLVSDCLFHNIRNQILKRQLNDSDFDVVLSTMFFRDDVSGKFIPKMATKASVSLVQTVHRIEAELIALVLNKYFEQPRYVCTGSVFYVDVENDMPEILFSNWNEKVKRIYFKAGNVEGPPHLLRQICVGYYVQKSITTLFQTEHCQVYKPSCSYLCSGSCSDISLTDYEKFLIRTYPSGLEYAYEEMLTSVKPFLESVERNLSLKPFFLLTGPRGSGKQTIVDCVSKEYGLNMWSVNCLELIGDSSGYMEGKLKYVFHKLLQYAPCILLLRNFECLGRDKDGHEDSRTVSAFQEEMLKMFQTLRSACLPVIVIASTAKEKQLVSALVNFSIHTIHIEKPSDEERQRMLDWVMKQRGLNVESEACLKHVAQQTSGFVLGDFHALVSHAVRNRYRGVHFGNEAIGKSEGSADTLAVDSCCIRMEDFEKSLDIMHAAYSDAIGAPRIPKVSWSDVGGLSRVKEEILRTINMPLQYPQLVESGLKRSGILLFGPPGTGKTLLAKAVATECNLNFLSVKGPELLNMYVGQSEENVREVFQRSRTAAPCVIFFDELDSLAPNRGKSGDSGGVMDRVVSQLLAEMDGLQKSSQVFIIGATNRPDLIDPALLRPGRFDKLLYVGVSEDRNTQKSIMKALTRKFNFSEAFNMDELIEELPMNLSGADMYSLCANAMLNAIKRRIVGIESGITDDKTSPVQVKVADFKDALKNLIPSVSKDDMVYYKQLKASLENK